MVGQAVDAYLPNRQRAMIVGVGGFFQRVDTGRDDLELGLVVGQDPHGRVYGRLHGMLSQNTAAQGVDRADHRFVELRPVVGQLRPRQHLAPDPLAHLGSGGVGERNGGQLSDSVVAKQGHVPLHEHTSLAAPGARGDEHVAPAVADDRALLAGQSHRFHRVSSLTRHTC